MLWALFDADDDRVQLIVTMPRPSDELQLLIVEPRWRRRAAGISDCLAPNFAMWPRCSTPPRPDEPALAPIPPCVAPACSPFPPHMGTIAVLGHPSLRAPCEPYPH